MTTPTSAASNAATYEALNARSSGIAASGSSRSGVSSAQEQSDRFLKLLTTQLTNQDPLNPMDNAQMTSQMAQISTVSGLEKLNSAITALGAQFMQSQALQGAALVGREVTMPGNLLARSGGQASGGFRTDVAMQATKVEVLNPSGAVVRTVNLGNKAAGMHQFDFADTGLHTGIAYTFRVSGQAGSATIDATEVVRDKVTAVSASGQDLKLELARGGSVDYAEVVSVR